MDFKNFPMLKTLAEANKEKFKTICFDWSVWKFFPGEEADTILRLNCFYEMLEPNGTFIVQYPTTVSQFVGMLSDAEKLKLRFEFNKLIWKCFNGSQFSKFTFVNSHDLIGKNELFDKGTLANIGNAFSSDVNKDIVLVAIKLV